jgi:hypothetical protein
MNGYLAEETVMTVAEIVPWLQEAIAHFTLVNGIASKGVTRSCCGIGRCILVECRTPRFK